MNSRYFLAALLAAGACAAQAATNDVPQSDAGYDSNDVLGPIVITPTLTPQPQSATLAPNTVITHADIERSQAHSVRELLARTPSLAIANQGGAGKITSIFLRGTNSTQTLVLVDGVRYGDATSGLTAIQNIPVGQIKRIEIIRGPRSSLYGADAIGGVIQIFTRDGEGVHGDKPYFSAGAGSYDTYKGTAGLSGGNEHAHYNVSISGTDSNGFNACTGRPFGAPGGGAGCFADQPDDDGYSRVAGSLRAGYRFDNGVNLGLHALRTDGDSEYDGSFSNQTDSTQESAGLFIAGPVLPAWQAKLSFGHSRDEQIAHNNGAFASDTETQRNSVKLKNDIALNADNMLTLGVDYRREMVDSNTAYTETSRDNTGAFIQYLGHLGRNQLQLALRGDDNEQFGKHATGSVTYGFHLTDVYTLTASYGTAFRAPTFNDLYFPSTPGFPPAANPDLDPEKSKSYEVGLDARHKWGQWSLHAYQTDIDDLIALNQVFTPMNISQARIRGVEASTSLQLRAWRINANADWVDARDRTNSATRNKHLPRRPSYSANLDVGRSFGRFDAGANMEYGGSRYDDLANTDKLDDYVLLGIRGSVHVTKAWQVQARVANLLDEDYETVDFYNQPGRTLFVTVRYQP